MMLAQCEIALLFIDVGVDLKKRATFSHFQPYSIHVDEFDGEIHVNDVDQGVSSMRSGRTQSR